MAVLFRQSAYSRLAGYEDLNDAIRLASDPTFRRMGSEKVWERGVALTSTLHWFETESLAREENLTGLVRLNRELVARALRSRFRIRDSQRQRFLLHWLIAATRDSVPSDCRSVQSGSAS